MRLGAQIIQQRAVLHHDITVHDVKASAGIVGQGIGEGVVVIGIERPEGTDHGTCLRMLDHGAVRQDDLGRSRIVRHRNREGRQRDDGAHISGGGNLEGELIEGIVLEIEEAAAVAAYAVFDDQHPIQDAFLGDWLDFEAPAARIDQSEGGILAGTLTGDADEAHNRADLRILDDCRVRKSNRRHAVPQDSRPIVDSADEVIRQT
jgi:hypothetical protein